MFHSHGIRRVTLLSVLALAFAIASEASAAVVTWTGTGGNSSIVTPSNWNTGVAPISADTLVFSGSNSLAPQLLSSLSYAAISFNSSASAFSIGGIGALTISTSAGITNNSLALQTFQNAITLGASQTWTANSAGLAFNGPLNLSTRTLTITGSNNVTIPGAVSGSGGITKSGVGALQLTSSNSYTGTTTISAGTLVIGHNSALGTGLISLSSGNVDVMNGARTVSNAFSVTGNPVFLASDALTFSGTGSLTSSRTFTVSGTAPITFSNAIGGATRVLTKAGAGTLVLLGTNTFASFTLSAGRIVIGNDSAFGAGTLSLGTGTLESNGSGARTLSNSVSLAGNTIFAGPDDFTFTGTSTLTNNRVLTVNNSNVTFSGRVMGSTSTYTLTKGGTGTLIFSGTSANTYTGATTVNDGKLVLVKTTGVNAVGGALVIGDGVGAAASAVVRLDAAGQIIDSSAVTIRPDGQLNLQGFSEAIGALTMTGGSIIGTAGSRLDLGGSVTVSGSSTNTATIGSDVRLNGNRTFTINENGVTTDVDLTVSGAITDGTVASSLTKSGTGMLALNGSNSYTGGTTLSAGGISVGTNYALGTGTVSLGTATLQSSGGARLFNNALTLAGNVTFAGADDLTFTGTAALNGNRILTVNNGTTTFSGPIVQDVAGRTLTKSGTGTLTLSGSTANAITGATTVNAGTLVLAKSSGLALGGSLVVGDSVGVDTVRLMGAGQLSGSAAVTVNGSGVFDLNGNNQSISALTVAGGAAVTTASGTLTLGGNLTHTGTGASSATISGNLDLTGSARTFTVGNSPAAVDLAVSAVISNGALTKAGAGTMLLGATNTYAGTTTVSAGTLQLGAANAIAAPSALVVASGATLDLNGYSQSAASLSGTGTVSLGAGTLTLGQNSATTFAGPITGSGGIVKNGTATLSLGGTSTYSGATSVNAGTVQFTRANVAATASAFTVASGAAINLNGFSQTVGSLAGSGNVSLAAGTLTLGGNGATTLFSGVISGSGGLTKTGAGTMTLTNASTLTGAVSINGGGVTLTGANAALASASGFTIGTGATLTLDNSAGENGNRIANGAAISLNGGTFSLISGSNGSAETIGALNALGGESIVSVTHNGGAGNTTSLTFNSLGTIANGATVNFSATGGTLGASASGPQIFITGQANGFIGGWATVGTDFADYGANGVRAFSGYYIGDDGLNENDPSLSVLLTSLAPLSATTLTNAGTTTDLSLNIQNVALVDLGSDATRTLNLLSGGLIKSTPTATTISGAGRLTAGGTAAGTLSVSVDAGHSLTITSRIIDNAGANGLYGDADDGVVSLSKADSGLLVLGGSNSFGGNVFINGGTVRISSESNLGAAGNDVTFNGGKLHVTSGFEAGAGKVFTVSSGLTGTLDLDAGQTLTLGNAADVLTTGNALSRLYKAGAGTLVVQNANAGFDGTLEVNGGSVELRHAQSLGDEVNRGAIVLNGGGLRLRNDADTAFGNDVSLAAAATIDVSGGGVNLALGTLSPAGNTLTVTGSNGARLSFASVVLTANTTFNTVSANLGLSGIGGAFGFGKSGAGTLILSGTNTYSGITTINAGAIQLGSADATSATSAVAIASGAALDLNGYNTVIGALSGSGNVMLGSGTLTTNVGAPSAFSGSLGGAGGFTKTGAGTLTLNGTALYSGATTINAGSLRLGHSDALADSTEVVIASGATLDLNSHDETIAALAGAGSVALGSGTLTLGSASSTFGGAIEESGGVVKAGAGTLVLNGANTFTGALTVNGGAVEVGNSTALGGTTTGTIVNAVGELRLGVSVTGETLLLAGALRNLAGNNTWTGAITLSGDATIVSDSGALTLSGAVSIGTSSLTVAGAGDTSFDGGIGGSGGFVKNGTGTVALTASNSFGAVVVNAGTLSVENADALGGTANGTTVEAGATLQLKSASGIAITGENLTLAGGGTLWNHSGDNAWSGTITLASDAAIGVAQDSLAVSGVITGSGGLTKSGAGELILNAANTYAGATNITAGTLLLGAAERIADGSALTVASGALFDLNDHDETIGSLAGAGDVDSGSATGATLAVGGNHGSTTFSGSISGLGDLVKSGTGAMTLSGSNSFSGDTTLNAGTLVAGNNHALGAGTLALNGGTLSSDHDARVIANAISVSGNVGGIGGGHSVTLTGAISGAGTLNVNVASGKAVTVNPGTANSVAPAIIAVQSGTLLLGGNDRIGDSTNIAVSSGGTFNTGGFSEGPANGAAGAPAGLGALTLSANSTLDFGAGNGSTLLFASFNYTPGTEVTIAHWSGAANLDNGSANNDRLLFANSSGLTESQLGSIQFTRDDGSNFVTGARELSYNGYYEIVPVPEPSTVLGAIALVGFIGFRERKGLAGMCKRARFNRRDS